MKLFIFFAFIICAGAQEYKKQPPKEEIWQRMIEATKIDCVTYESKIIVNRPNKTIISTSRVYLEGFQKGLIEVLSPPKDRGFKVLRIKEGSEEAFWIYLPQINKVIRATGKGSFLESDFIYSDILGIDLKKNYQLVDVQDVDRETYLAKIEAKPHAKDILYPIICYWVSSKDYLPTKAEFYGLEALSAEETGKQMPSPIKIIEFKEFKEVGKKKMPTKIVCRLGFSEDYKTTLEVLSYSTKPIPKRIFTKEYLKKGL